MPAEAGMPRRGRHSPRRQRASTTSDSGALTARFALQPAAPPPHLAQRIVAPPPGLTACTAGLAGWTPSPRGLAAAFRSRDGPSRAVSCSPSRTGPTRSAAASVDLHPGSPKTLRDTRDAREEVAEFFFSRQLSERLQALASTRESSTRESCMQAAAHRIRPCPPCLLVAFRRC